METTLVIWYKQREAIISIVIISLISLAIGLAIGCTSSPSQHAESPVSTSSNPKPSATTEPIKPISLSGTDRVATEKFELRTGLATAKYTYEGSGNFSVTLMDSNGEYAGLLANEIDASTGSSAHQVRAAGPYLLDIMADGPWTVEITQ